MGYVFAFVSGFIIGSFLNIYIYRIFAEGAFVYPFLQCPACKGRPRWYNRLPFINYALLKGRCGHCGIEISPKYPIIELMNAAFYTAVLHRYGLNLIFIKAASLISLGLAAAVIDIREQIIPNGLMIFGLITGLALPIIYNGFCLGDVLGGFMLGGGALLLVAVFSRGNLGGGDIKLMAVIGLFLGQRLTLVTLFVSFISGGLFGMIALITGKKKSKDSIPFGPFISGAAIFALFWGEMLISIYLSMIEVFYLGIFK